MVEHGVRASWLNFLRIGFTYLLQWREVAGFYEGLQSQFRIGPCSNLTGFNWIEIDF